MASSILERLLPRKYRLIERDFLDGGLLTKHFFEINSSLKGFILEERTSKYEEEIIVSLSTTSTIVYFDEPTIDIITRGLTSTCSISIDVKEMTLIEYDRCRARGYSIYMYVYFVRSLLRGGGGGEFNQNLDVGKKIIRKSSVNLPSFFFALLVVRRLSRCVSPWL